MVLKMNQDTRSIDESYDLMHSYLRIEELSLISGALNCSSKDSHYDLYKIKIQQGPALITC